MNWLKTIGNNNGRERRLGSEISSHNNESERGCGLGLINIIKHQHWPHFMRRLTHHKRKRLVAASISDKLIVEEEIKESAPPRKNNSIKSRVKTILAEEIHKVKSRKNQNLSKRDKAFAPEMGPNSQDNEAIASNEKYEPVDEPQRKLPENMKLNPIRTDINNADSFLRNPKEYFDALEIISANEEFLVKVLHDPGSPLAHHFRNQQALNTKQGLAKSETFPRPSSSGKRVSKQSRFKETPRVESEGNEMAGVSHNPFLDSPKRTKHFKDLKQKIKHMIRESQKEMLHRVAMDAVIHKIPCDQKIRTNDSNQFKNFEACDGRGKDKDSPSGDNESDCSVPSFGKNKPRLRHMRRASSLNESMDKYRQLYETSFNRDGKQQRSVRMEASPKNLTRIYSLPDLKSYLNPNEESSDDFSFGRSFDERTNEGVSKNHLQTDFPMESIDEEDPTDVIVIKSSIENEVTLTFSINKATESIIEEDPIELSEINSTNENEVVLTSTENNEETIQRISNMTESGESEIGPVLLIDNLVKHEDACETENVEEIPGKHLMCDNDISNLEVKAKDKAEFSYVKDILEISGFSGDGLLGTWHSDDQPLNPLVYEEAKGCLVFDPDCCGNDESGGKCDHPLLFDMINEVLMEIYAKSYSYYPFPLSSLSHISPMPIGQHVLREVWGLISWHLGLRSEVDQSLDQIVGSDLAKSGWWMNLQFDCECVGLELEDLIFEDLLEETILEIEPCYLGPT